MRADRSERLAVGAATFGVELAEAASAAERSAVDAVLSNHGVTPARRPGPRTDRVEISSASIRAERRSLLLPGLHSLVDVAGWASPAGLSYLAEQLGLRPAEVWGVATFYDLVPTAADKEYTERRCGDVICGSISGTGPDVGDSAAAGGAGGAGSSSCLGQCDAGAAVLQKVPGTPYAVQRGASGSAAPTRCGAFDAQSAPAVGRVLARVLALGSVTSFDDYLGAGGGAGLVAAVHRGAEATIAEIEAAGLRGRGGAAFPTAAKLRGVRAHVSSPKYVVVNGDESEPGTFKDRILMERDPYAVIEGAMISALAVGAERVIVYVRGEYPDAIEAIRRSIAEFAARGWIGPNRTVDGAALEPLQIEVRAGGGAYICGEETALLNSIEGHRGEPRAKPPFPSDHGLFGRPTLINNVETLCHQVEISAEGAEVWRSHGTPQSPGTRLFSVSGKVEHPGVYEWPMGVSLEQVIRAAGGRVAEISAVLLGGAAGTFLAPERFGLPMSFEGTREAGVSMGSGAVIAFGHSTDWADVAARISRFFAHESCGTCVPCRGGTHQIEKMFQRGWTGGRDQAERFDHVARAMTDASICGLGQSASLALGSMLELGLISGEGQ